MKRLAAFVLIGVFLSGPAVAQPPAPPQPDQVTLFVQEVTQARDQMAARYDKGSRPTLKAAMDVLGVTWAQVYLDSWPDWVYLTWIDGRPLYETTLESLTESRRNLRNATPRPEDLEYLARGMAAFRQSHERLQGLMQNYVETLATRALALDKARASGTTASTTENQAAISAIHRSINAMRADYPLFRSIVAPPLDLSGIWTTRDVPRWAATYPGTISIVQTGTEIVATWIEVPPYPDPRRPKIEFSERFDVGAEAFRGRLSGNRITGTTSLRHVEPMCKPGDWSFPARVDLTVSQNGTLIEGKAQSDQTYSIHTINQKATGKCDVLTVPTGLSAMFSLVRQQTTTAPAPAPADEMPDIHAVFVLEDQTRDLGRGVSSYEYPFRGNQTDSAFIYRTLFVVGRNLPGTPGPAPRVASSDKFIDYSFLNRVPRDTTGSLQAPLYARGWQALAAAGGGVEAAAGLDAVVVRATLKRGVIPGPASFTLNGADASWVLAFGNARAQISFVRALRGSHESTSDLFLPESTAVEVRTAIDLPMDRVPIVIGRNGQPIELGGGKTVDATRVAGSPRVYRTAPIALREGSSPTGAKLEVPAALGDELQSMIANEAFIVEPAVATVRVHRTPSQLGGTWKEALVAAARCTNTDLTDFDQLADAQAIEITNTIVTHLERRRLRVSLGDHAAMLLLRDTFVQMMREQRATLPAIGTDRELRLLYRALASQADAPDFFLKPFEVASPGVDPFDVEVSRAFSKAYLEYHFPGDPEEQERWALGALREALTEFHESFDAAIARAAGTQDCEVEALLDLTGAGFDAVAGRLAPRLMKLQEVAGPPMRFQWVPDERGRFHVRTLANLAAAVRAQAEFSSADTQVLVAAVTSAAALPGVFTKAAWAAYVAVAGDVADAAINTFIVAHDYYRNDREYQFARGAAEILGQDRLREAEANLTTPVEALLNIGLSAFGGTTSLRSGMTTARLAKGQRLIGQVNDLDALKKLPEADRRNVLGFMDEAHRARAAGETLSDAQKQAIALTERLDEQARLANSTQFHQRLAEALKGTDAEALQAPLNVVSRDEFQRLNGSRGGQSVVRIENGKPVVYVAEGADPGALVEEAIHLRQLADPNLAPLVRKLDEAKLQRWQSLDPEEQIDLYRTKLRLEIDAQQKLIKQVDAAAQAGDVNAYRQIDDAWQHLEGLRSRYGELAALDPRQLRRNGQTGAPEWFAEPPRLFNMEPSGTHALDASVANAKELKEFVAAYQTRFPNSSLSEADLTTRFNQKQRLNPETGRLRYADSKTPPRPDVPAAYHDQKFTTYDVGGNATGKPLPLDKDTQETWNKLLQARDKARHERDALLKAATPDEDALASALREVNESSRKLGELGGDAYVPSQYAGAVRRYPPGEVSVSRNGEFDQVFEWVNPKTERTEYIVVEAKGGSSRLGSKMAGGERVQQGTRRYYESIVETMMKRAVQNKDAETLKLLQGMNGADTSSAIHYLHVQVPIDAAGTANAIRVNRFDLSPPKPVTPPGGDGIADSGWPAPESSPGNAGTVFDPWPLVGRSPRPLRDMPDTGRWWRHAA